jgi:hypothetical protein
VCNLQQHESPAKDGFVMAFQPLAFVGRPLSELAAALANIPGPELAELGGYEVRLHQMRCDLPTIDLDARLPPDHPNVEIPGIVLERYLGGGGQGCVFAGRILATGKVVAVKILAPSIGALRGVREALLTSRVRHPNVLRILRTQPVSGCWIVVMELVIGATLAEIDDLPEVAGVFGKMAEAIRAVAAARLVHRDIKPANILVRRSDDTPVLVDFGLAVDLGTMDDEAMDVSGTPFFLPPEAWNNVRPDPSWDAYALGVTAAVVLGQPRDLPYDLTALRVAKLSGAFDRTIIRCLQGIDHPVATWAMGLVNSNADRRWDTLTAGARSLAA